MRLLKSLALARLRAAIKNVSAFLIRLTRGSDRLGLVFAVENLSDKYDREQFQFAPARGRTFTVGLNVGGF